MLYTTQPIIDRVATTTHSNIKKVSSATYPREMFCRYSFYTCGRKRALKRNGTLHTLCDKHRQDANRNQRRLAHRRKQEHVKQCEMQKAIFTKPVAPIVKVRLPETSTTNVKSIPMNTNMSLDQEFNLYETTNVPSSVFRTEDVGSEIDLIYGSFEPSLEMMPLEDEDISWLEQTLWEDVTPHIPSFD
jgi:hypothetical protein